MPDILYERFPSGHYAIFKMNRPDRLNAQGAAMSNDLAAAMEEFTLDPEMRVGIVTGEGRAFSAGADLREMAERNAASGQRDTPVPPPESRTETGRLGQPFARNPKPFIAAINGLAIAAGMERAADCDIRIASTEAYFGLFEVRRGILPGYAMHNLARVMPFGEAMYLMLTGDTMSVAEAHRLGFVHEVVEPHQLMIRAVEIAEMIGGKRSPGGAGHQGRGAVLAAAGPGGIPTPWSMGFPLCFGIGGRKGRAAGLRREADAGVEGPLIRSGDW